MSHAVTIVVLGLGLMLYALLSRPLERKAITPAILFVALGGLVSPAGLNLIDFSVDGSFVRAIAEFALAIILFSDASRIDFRKLENNWSLPMRLLGLALPLAILAGWVTGWLLLPGLPLWPALVLAIILAPTDAASIQAVLSNERVPAAVRQSLNVESGLNDGIALPFLLIAVSMTGAALDHGAPSGLADWATFVGISIVLGAVVGGALGMVGGYLIQRAHDADRINLLYLRLSSVAMALLALGIAELVTANGFIAAWAAGLATGNVARKSCSELYSFGAAEGELLTVLVIFIFGGAMLPAALGGLDTTVILYAILSLTLVRMVPVALSLAGSGARLPTALFLGWFGPRGVASILYILVAVAGADFAGNQIVLQVAAVTIGLSILLHGVSATPLSNLYGAWIGRLESRETPEHTETELMAVRNPFPFRRRSS